MRSPVRLNTPNIEAKKYRTILARTVSCHRPLVFSQQLSQGSDGSRMSSRYLTSQKTCFWIRYRIDRLSNQCTRVHRFFRTYATHACNPQASYLITSGRQGRPDASNPPLRRHLTFSTSSRLDSSVSTHRWTFSPPRRRISRTQTVHSC
jgi:hypothetical protein